MATDWTTKWPEAKALPDIKSETIAKFFFDDIIARHGAPREIVHDNASDLVSKLFRGLQDLFKIRRIETAPYQPNSQGAVERLNKTLIEALRTHVQEDPIDWDQYLSTILFAYRTSVQASTNETLAYLNFAHLGVDERLPPEIESLDKPYGINEM